MLVSSLTPALNLENRVLFDFSCLWQAPENSGCYVLTNNNNVILYIGQAVNIHNRLEQHLNDIEKRKRTPDGKGFWFYYQFCPIIDLDDLERGWMNDHKIYTGKRPFFNKIDPPT